MVLDEEQEDNGLMEANRELSSEGQVVYQNSSLLMSEF